MHGGLCEHARFRMSDRLRGRHLDPVLDFWIPHELAHRIVSIVNFDLRRLKPGRHKRHMTVMLGQFGASRISANVLDPSMPVLSVSGLCRRREVWIGE
jgi:hypothetical protein